MTTGFGFTRFTRTRRLFRLIPKLHITSSLGRRAMVGERKEGYKERVEALLISGHLIVSGRNRTGSGTRSAVADLALLDRKPTSTSYRRWAIGSLVCANSGLSRRTTGLRAFSGRVCRHGGGRKGYVLWGAAGVSGSAVAGVVVYYMAIGLAT